MSEFDQYLFGQGVHYEIYHKLGAHPAVQDGVSGIYFAVWAPGAKDVSLVGDFNNWKAGENPMTKLEPLGIWELFVPGLAVGSLYKYAVHGSNDRTVLKCDPYGYSSELRPGTASKVAVIDGFKWSDKLWMDKRASFDFKHSAMSIYELHPGSWMKHPTEDEDDPGYYNFRELAPVLADYLQKMGYNYVEMMGIAEHPFDGSWGYQVTGYYAPTSRHGSPADFMYFVNYLHRKKIGVILDWVPAHFPRDAHGLANFDGGTLYEYADPRKGEHPDWGTKVFDFERNEVKNFLLANALYWLKEYHVDGLRIDAVASMLYLDYGRQDGQWVANKYGDNKNLEAIEFFHHLNSIVHSQVPGAVMIAEESTAWPKVTGSLNDGGLGFDLKWNMGWMNDFLEYMKLDPLFRKFNHNKMTFSMAYAYSENYVLVLSHDEVVHLKCSMLEKMPGFEIDKFRNLMAAYTFMMGHPGKKLLFMGQEFAQRREWSEARELDWFLLKDEKHQHVQNLVSALNKMYLKYPALYARDDTWDGFQWINANDGDRSIFSYVRYSPTGRNNMLFVVNFTPIDRPDYRVGVPKKKKYKLALSTKMEEFGGTGEPETTFTAVKGECDGQPFSISYPLPPYGAAIFTF
ncbi:MAG: 1,4-alpha-glucan branching protein GlgB [Butyricicoccaceae bacterium]